MIEKIVSRKTLHDITAPKSDYDYWMSKNSEEGLNAVEYLRKQFYVEYPGRLQRIYKITKLK